LKGRIRDRAGHAVSAAHRAHAAAVHMVDVSDGSGRDDVVKDVNVILGELASFGAELEKKPA